MKNLPFSAVWSTSAFFVLFLAVLFVTVMEHWKAEPRATESVRIIPASIRHQIADQPLSFVANRGQTGDAALYHVQGAGHTVLFHRNRISLRRQDEGTEMSEVVLQFEGASTKPNVEGVEKLRGVAHFYKGADPENWQTNVPTFASVKYTDIYPGIDMVYFGRRGVLESEYLIAPRADATQIKMHYSNVQSIAIREDGALVLQTALGELVEKAPFAYQDINGLRREIAAEYALFSDGIVGFTLGSYDPSRKVVIDPEIVFTTIIESISASIFNGVDFDLDGNLVFAGSANRFFPADDVIPESNHAGGLGNDGLLVKMDKTTGEVIYSALFGGSRLDNFRDITVGDDGSIYLTGLTASDDFPTLNPVQATRTGSENATLVIFNSNTELTYSTYLGGSERDWGVALDLDTDGSIYIVGRTESPDFPIVGGFQSVFAGGADGSGFPSDAFVTKFNTGGTIDYSTFLGGSGDDDPCRITVNNDGEVTVGNTTGSTDFPLMNAYQGVNAGGESDMAITRLNSAGSGLVYSTYFGGSEIDICSGIAPGVNDEVVLSGSTTSQDFPIIGADSFPGDGESDGSVIMLDHAGAPVYAVRTNTPGFDRFDALDTDELNGAHPVGAYQNKVQVYFKPEEGPLALEFEHDGPGIFLSDSRFSAGSMALSGTYTASPGKGFNSVGINSYPIPQGRSPGSGNSIGELLDNLVWLYQTAFDVNKETILDDPLRPVQVGESVWWKITISNSTGRDLSNVVVQDVPQDGVSIPETGEFEIDNFGRDQSQEFIVRTKIDRLQEGQTKIENKVLVSFGVSRPSQWTFERSAESGEGKLKLLPLTYRSGTGKQVAAAVLDIYLDGDRLVDDIDDHVLSENLLVEHRNASPLLEIVPGTSADNSDPLASVVIDLTVPDEITTTRLSDQTLIVLNHVLEDSVTALVKLEARLEAVDPLTTEFFVANATDAPIDVTLLSDGTGKGTAALVIDDLEAGMTSDYVSVPPGVHYLEVTNADQSTLFEVFEFDWTNSEGDADAIVLGTEAGALHAFSFDGTGAVLNPSVVTSMDDVAAIPTSFQILANYPNPFNPSTTIQYELGGATKVMLAVYDALGRRVRTLVNREGFAGRFEVVWDGRNESGALVASGTYIARLETPTQSHSRRLTLIK